MLHPGRAPVKRRPFSFSSNCGGLDVNRTLAATRSVQAWNRRAAVDQRNRRKIGRDDLPEPLPHRVDRSKLILENRVNRLQLRRAQTWFLLQAGVRLTAVRAVLSRLPRPRKRRPTIRASAHHPPPLLASPRLSTGRNRWTSVNQRHSYGSDQTAWCRGASWYRPRNPLLDTVTVIVHEVN
jgi:hypothetical protein